MFTFLSKTEKLGKIALPKFSGIRVLMMPVVLGDPRSLPSSMQPWAEAFVALSNWSGFDNETAYLTIDESLIRKNETHRRSGIHVDGVPITQAGAIWGGAGGDGGSIWNAIIRDRRSRLPPDMQDWIESEFPLDDKKGGLKRPPARAPKKDRRHELKSIWGNGFIMASSLAGCRVWNQEFHGWPGKDGDCMHLADQCRKESESVLEASTAYWCDPMCVHESMPMQNSVKRQFVRLSLPSDAAWYGDFTANPKGVAPSGPILPPREGHQATIITN